MDLFCGKYFIVSESILFLGKMEHQATFKVSINVVQDTPTILDKIVWTFSFVFFQSS